MCIKNITHFCFLHLALSESFFHLVQVKFKGNPSLKFEGRSVFTSSFLKLMLSIFNSLIFILRIIKHNIN